MVDKRSERVSKKDYSLEHHNRKVMKVKVNWEPILKWVLVLYVLSRITMVILNES
jgi:hypothetical protein